MTARSTDWHIAYSSLPPYAEWSELQWPSASEKELRAWSAFCGMLEHCYRHRLEMRIPCGDLTDKQRHDAISDIHSRGWKVIRNLLSHELYISPPDSIAN